MTHSAAPAPRGASVHIVSLADRMGYVQALRAAFVGVVLGTGFFASPLVGSSVAELILVASFYLVVAASVEAIRHLMRSRGLALVSVMLLLDGVFLAWSMYATGGTQSPLRFLAYLHIVAVSLLASYRTGLKIALWHSLLFFAMFYAQAAELIPQVEGLLPTSAPEFYRISVLNVLALLSVAVVTALFSSLNERELRKRKTDLEALTALTAEVETKRDAGAIAQVVLDRVCEAFVLPRAIILSYRGGELEVLAYRGHGEPAEVPEGVDPLMQATWEKRSAQLVKELDVNEAPRLGALLPMARNLVVAPLIAEGEPIGILCVEHPSRIGGKIERRVVQVVETIASHTALAISNAWLLEQTKQMADIDALTGIANRRVLESMLEREVARAKRSGERVTLLMLDIDNFKTINDEAGHPEGDEVLREVATALARDARQFDTVARYGGDEFAVILSTCSSRESLALAERFRNRVATAASAHPVKLSAGVATFPTHAADVDALVKAADEALYESKRAGRDRVTRSRRRAGDQTSVTTLDAD